MRAMAPNPAPVQNYFHMTSKELQIGDRRGEAMEELEDFEGVDTIVSGLNWLPVRAHASVALGPTGNALFQCIRRRLNV